MNQGLRHDLETGCPNLTISKLLGLHFLGTSQINSDYNHKHVFTHGKRHSILVQCHRIYVEVTNFY